MCVLLTVVTVLGALLIGGFAYENRNPSDTSGDPTGVTPGTYAPTPPALTLSPTQTGAPPVTGNPAPTLPDVLAFPTKADPFNPNASAPDLGPTFPKCNTSADCGPYPNATSYGCTTEGYCTITSCVYPYGNCDGGVTNGCESDLLTDAHHCGSCNSICPSSHSIPVCTAGVCDTSNITCIGTWANCNNIASDFCETDTSTNIFHCGQCNSRCEADFFGHVLSVYCFRSQCAIFSCSDGWGNCNQLYNDGCETPIVNNNLHCGQCYVPCDLTKSCCNQKQCAFSVGKSPQFNLQPDQHTCISDMIVNGTCVENPQGVDTKCCVSSDCVNNGVNSVCNGVTGLYPFTNGQCGT